MTLRNIPCVLEHSSCGWTCEYDAATDSFRYLVSVLAPMDTQIPPDFQFRHVPQTLVAVGLWGDTVGKIVKRMEKLGFVTSWHDDPGLGWNAELYLDEEAENPPPQPKPNKEGCRWMVPCKRSVSP